MNQAEYSLLEDIYQIKETISVDHLKNKQNRTLLYGYTCDRDTWHVYLQDNKIKLVTYRPETILTELIIDSNEDYIPNKRLYPERCDFEFCKLMKKRGIRLPFTTWTENIPEKQYYGKIIEL